MSWLESSLSVKDNDQALVCFASDVGILLYVQLWKSGLVSAPVILNHLDKGVNIFDNELRELSKNNPNLTYKTSETFSQSQAFLKNAVVKYGNQAIYLLTGQPDDINEMKNFLKENGMATNRYKQVCLEVWNKKQTVFYVSESYHYRSVCRELVQTN